MIFQECKAHNGLYIFRKIYTSYYERQLINLVLRKRGIIMKRLMTVVTVVFVMIASTMTTMAASTSYMQREIAEGIAETYIDAKSGLVEISEEYGATWRDLKVWVVDFDEDGDPIFACSFRLKGRRSNEHLFTIVDFDGEKIYVDGVAYCDEAGVAYWDAILNGVPMVH